MKNRFIASIAVVLTMVSCSKKEVNYDSIIGSLWNVVEFESNNNKILLDEATEQMLFFVDSTKFSGISTCNKYIGKYSINGKDINMDVIGSTKMMCQDDAMDIENRYINAISGTLKIEISSDGKQLTLINPQNSSKIVFNKTENPETSMANK